MQINKCSQLRDIMQGCSRVIIVDVCKVDPLPPLELQIKSGRKEDVLKFGMAALRMVIELVPVPPDVSWLTITISPIEDLEEFGFNSGVKICCLELPYVVNIEGVEVDNTLGPFFRDINTFERIHDIDGIPLWGDLALIERGQ